MVDVESMPTRRFCTECGKRMKIRTSSRNGRQSWGCSGYPKCYNTAKIIDGTPTPFMLNINRDGDAAVDGADAVSAGYIESVGPTP